MNVRNSNKIGWMLCAAMAVVWLGAAKAVEAQAVPADLSPDVQEVLTLSHQHMDDSVITNYIASTGKSYKLSADDIIYLNSQGVSQGVITALLQASAAGANAPAPTPTPAPVASAAAAPDPAPPAANQSDAPPATTSAPDVSASAPPISGAPAIAPPPTPTLDYFQSQLAPYGNWINLPGYGLCWQPNVSPGWRPYYDGGHWEYTDAGWFWQSDYLWGDIVFHYGRWAYTTSGWVWVPGYEYAPAWVVWRHDDADGYIGWAPLPPGAVFVNGGWLYDGQPVGADFDFGLGINFFTFIGYDHFWEHDYRHFIVPHDRLVFVFGHSGIENHYRYDHGVFVNVGLGHDRMVTFTHHDFHPVGMGAMRHDEATHNAMQRNNDMHNYHSGGWGNGQGGWGHQQQSGGGWR